MTAMAGRRQCSTTGDASFQWRPYHAVPARKACQSLRAFLAPSDRLSMTRAFASTQDKKEPNPADEHVGARVRMRRVMLGMSQEKLADGLGLTFQQVQKYEKGSNRIGASRLQQIALVLRVPVSFFFEGFPADRRRQAAT